MNDFEQLTVLIYGFVAPFLISLLKNTTWRAEWKLLLAIGVSFVFAVIDSVLVRGNFEMTVQNATTIFAVATVVYKLILEQSNLNHVLEKMLYNDDKEQSERE